MGIKPGTIELTIAERRLNVRSEILSSVQGGSQEIASEIKDLLDNLKIGETVRLSINHTRMKEVGEI